MTKKTKTSSVRCMVKRRSGEYQPYDERKIYASVYAASYVAGGKEKECEHIANSVVRKINGTIAGKKEVSSLLIHHLAVRYLKEHNQDASFMYDTHKDIA